MKYKVIKEYKRFYLAESPNGYKECFMKYEYKKDNDGYIYKRIPEYEGHEINPDKVNRAFSPFGELQRRNANVG